MSQKTFAELCEDLDAAVAAHKAAADCASRARSDEITALNRLNDAQKAFSAAVEAKHREAPMDSDWKRGQRMKPSLAV